MSSEGSEKSPWLTPSPEFLGGIAEALGGPLEGSNRVASAFYDGPGWARFRPWERAFLAMVGGVKARRQILRHLGESEGARVLEVGIGDGENVPLLPTGWEVYGVDLARSRLEGALTRFPTLFGRLARAEGEALPFADGSFDSAFSVGGFNYFRDQAAALREMRRVTRPGGVLVVADERPDLHRFMIGHWIGVPSLSAWILRRTGLDREFVDLVLNHRSDAEGAAAREWPGFHREAIWAGLGYCLVARA